MTSRAVSFRRLASLARTLAEIADDVASREETGQSTKGGPDLIALAGADVVIELSILRAQGVLA